MPIELFKSIDILRAEHLAKIDELTGQARLKYITSAPGQDIIYALKRDEATKYVAAGYPSDLTDYPFIAAESTATLKTPTQVVDTILAKCQAWITAGAVIDAQKQKAKDAIANPSATVADMRSAVADFVVAIDF